LVAVAKNVIALVRADISTVPIFTPPLGCANVTLPELVKAAVSCANGKLLILGVPDGVVAHAVAVQKFEPAKFQYTVFGAGNVIPELPPQSPALVGEAPAAEPAIVMSLKSQSFAEIALAVIVLVVPIVSERTKALAIAEEPATVKVPVTVWFAAKINGVGPKESAAVKDRLLNVLMPLMV
jgi:hypothetical protein